MSQYLHLHTSSDYQSVSATATNFILDELPHKPDLLLCVASGSSPLGAYRGLAKACAQNPDLFARLRILKLDEWGPLPAEHPGSCEYYVQRELIGPLHITPDRYLTIPGDAPEPEAACRRYAEVLDASGPIDLCVLGLGLNGHLGLNEPADWLCDTVHVAELAEESKAHPMLQAGSPAALSPSYGLTLGMGDILRSRKILLIVSGASKRVPLQQFLTRQISTRFPASLLWIHSDVTLLSDRDAHQ
ncbi:MAG: 6-phosphogluconolactonase [Candidatus Hydrogenedentes bacterium]|nr:6-phosphogluconolactonase [Candidatus Hydrogenedentota bacterium]